MADVQDFGRWLGCKATDTSREESRRARARRGLLRQLLWTLSPWTLPCSAPRTTPEERADSGQADLGQQLGSL